MQLASLPRELIRTTVLLLPRQSQKSLSLVSKAWRFIILPQLFNSITLHSRPGNEGFIQRVLDEEDKAHERQRYGFRYHVHRLSADLEMEEGQLETFGRALSKLQNLEYLHWNVSALASNVEWYNTLGFLLGELPKLRSISLVMGLSGVSVGDSFEATFLSNLRELSIHFNGISDDELDDELNNELNNELVGVPNTLVGFIRSARNIKTLSMIFDYCEENWTIPWTSVDIFSALSSDCFPNLRKFSTNSQLLSPVPNFFGSDFQQFVQNHRQLEKLILNADCYCPNDTVKSEADITPEFVEDLMPSIRHFGGPGYLAGALLISNLSRQLEVLELVDPTEKDFGRIYRLLQQIGDSIGPELPCLRGLSIFMEGCDDDDETGLGEWPYALGALFRMSNNMPALEELVISTWKKPKSDDLNGLLQLLSRLPHLHRLAIPKIENPGHDETLSDEFRDFYERAKGSFPQLHIVSSSEFSLNLL